jgi:hypothetical protein
MQHPSLSVPSARRVTRASTGAFSGYLGSGNRTVGG